MDDTTVAVINLYIDETIILNLFNFGNSASVIQTANSKRRSHTNDRKQKDLIRERSQMTSSS